MKEGRNVFKNIIWDFDGTLANTYPEMVSVFKRALMDSGIEENEDEILKYMKLSVGEALNHYKELYSLGADFVEAYVHYEKNVDLSKIAPFEYAKEICEAFRESGGSNFILTHRGNSTLKYLKLHNMLDSFTEIGTKHNKFKRKPHPEGFVYFVEKYNMCKESTLAIGDRECDIVGAKGADIKTCLYNSNNIISAGTPDFYINSLSELFNILELS